jgi:hypothetical protein
VFNLKFGAGAASRYGSGSTKMMRFRLRNTVKYKFNYNEVSKKNIPTFGCFEIFGLLNKRAEG